MSVENRIVTTFEIQIREANAMEGNQIITLESVSSASANGQHRCDDTTNTITVTVNVTVTVTVTAIVISCITTASLLLSLSLLSYRIAAV